jgi:hypothetical protein
VNFDYSSVIRLDGVDVVTTFVDPNHITAIIPSSDLANTGSINVTVFSGTLGTESDAMVFWVNNPVPIATSISPTSVSAGASGFTLTVNGSNFNADSVVYWGGSPLATTLISSSQLTAVVTTGLLVSGLIVHVTVRNPIPGGGSSTSQDFSINNPVPATTSISPTSCAQYHGYADLFITVNGTNFVPTSQAKQWYLGGGRPIPTTFVSSTQLTCIIPFNYLLTSISPFEIKVVNSTPGGGTSNGQTFTVTA